MSDPTPNIVPVAPAAASGPLPYTSPKRGRPHLSVTPERRRIFLETLRQTGSLRASATAASQHIINDGGGYQAGRGNPRAGQQTFATLRRRDPEFDAEVQEAISEALGRAEVTLADRMRTPDSRPVVDKAGNVVGTDVNWRSANQLLLRFLERQDRVWVQRREVNGTQTIINGDGAPAGLSFHITADDVRKLDVEQQRQLFELLDLIQAGQDDETKALPAPEGLANV